MVDGRLMHVMWYQNRVGHGSLRRPSSDSGVRAKVLEVIVRSYLSGDQKPGVNAALMQQHNITEEDIEVEVAIKQGRSPKIVEKPQWPLKPGLEKPEEAKPVQEKPVHVEPARENWTGNGNCLIIPLLGKWESIRLLDTTGTPNLLEDISKSLALPIGESRYSYDKSATPRAIGGEMLFHQFDIYDIVLAERPIDIPKILPQIAPDKRPDVNDAVFGLLQSWYNCPVALCCFNTSQNGETKPLGFAFEPLYPDKIVVYTLDGRDGRPPDPNKLVRVDHEIFVGSYLMQAERHAKVKYSDSIPSHLSPYVLFDVLGKEITQDMENGDFLFSVEDVRKGIFQGFRCLPPFAPAGLPRLGHEAVREYGYIQR